MAVFSPFQEFYSVPVIIAYSCVVLVMLSINILLLPRILIRWFDNENWTLARHLIFVFYVIFSISTVITIINIILRGWDNCQPFIQLYLTDLLHVALIGIFPMAATTFIIKDRLIRSHQIKGQKATKKLKAIQKSTNDTGNIIIQSDTQEQLELILNDFVAGVAKDNYTNIYWNTTDGISQKLLRITLKNLEAQVCNEYIVRCHRSYLINLKSVNQVLGNANGYKLRVNDLDWSIPVSRIKGKEILRKINSLR